MAFNTTGQDGNATVSLSNSLSSQLMQIMQQDAIEPGSEPSYEACKTIYAYHPLGARMVDAPLEMAMSQEREIEIPGAPEERLIKAFNREWDRIGTIGANQIIFRVSQLSHIYGIATLGVNEKDSEGNAKPTNEPLDFKNLYKADLYFNIYDPLNTAGSLVLNQDPAATDFMHPRQVEVSGKSWNNTKALVMMHEQPIWIEWTNSAFGFVGRSVYQRAFFPLKSFLNSMIADDLIQEKLGLIVYKAKSPGSILDRVALAFANAKRALIKDSQTGNVLQIGEEEEIETLRLENVHLAGEYSRTNIIKNVATAAGQPAIFLLQDTLAEGFGEGSEDAKQIARYIDGKRIEMAPAYDFMDKIVQHRAWNPHFYEEIQKDFPEQYGNVSYEAALQSWQDAFTATWPNLLSEPDSDRAKVSEAKLKMAAELAQKFLENGTQKTKADVLDWLTEVINDESEFYSSPLLIDRDDIEQFEPMPDEPFE